MQQAGNSTSQIVFPLLRIAPQRQRGSSSSCPCFRWAGRVAADRTRRGQDRAVASGMLCCSELRMQLPVLQDGLCPLTPSQRTGARSSYNSFCLKAAAQGCSWTFYSIKNKRRKGSAYWFSCDPDHLRGVVGGFFLSPLFKVQSLNYCSSKFVLVLFSRWDTAVNFHSKRLIVHEVQWCTVQTSAEHSQLSPINSFALANSASL